MCHPVLWSCNIKAQTGNYRVHVSIWVLLLCCGELSLPDIHGWAKVRFLGCVIQIWTPKHFTQHLIENVMYPAYNKKANFSDRHYKRRRDQDGAHGQARLQGAKRHQRSRRSELRSGGSSTASAIAERELPQSTWLPTEGQVRFLNSGSCNMAGNSNF